MVKFERFQLKKIHFDYKLLWEKVGQGWKLTVMFEDFDGSAGQPQAEDETGVILLITKHTTARTEKSGDVEGVGGEPHAKHNGILHPQKPGRQTL